MSTSWIMKPCWQQAEKHPGFLQAELQKPLKIKKQMIDSLRYVKSNQSKVREILDIRIKTFFDAIVEATKLGLEFTEEERKEIGPLIKETILDIDDCLFAIGEGFDIDEGPEALVVRSGFQFMIENFKDFPDGNQDTLEKAFHYFRETESIDTLDESLASWKESPLGSDENVQHGPEALNRPKDIPASHHWWF